MKIEQHANSAEVIGHATGIVSIEVRVGSAMTKTGFPAAQARELFTAGLSLCNDIDPPAKAAKPTRTVASLFEPQSPGPAFSRGDKIMVAGFEYLIAAVADGLIGLIGMDGCRWGEPAKHIGSTGRIPASVIKSILHDYDTAYVTWRDGSPIFPVETATGRLAVGMRVKAAHGEYRIVRRGFGGPDQIGGLNQVGLMCGWTMCPSWIAVEDTEDIKYPEATQLLGEVADWLIVEEGE